MSRMMKNVRGDTIIEVLLSMTVLSLILSASYTLANRNSQSLRQSQERSEGLKVAEAQLEALKVFLANPGAALPANASTPFCMSGGTAVQDAGFSSVPANPQSDPLNNYPAACKVSGEGAEQRYNIVIQRPSANTFAATVRWVRTNGQGIEQAQVFYRVYPDSVLNNVGTPTDLGGCERDFYDPTGLGQCIACPAGYRSPPNSVGADKCEPIPPKIQIVVNQVPSCGSGARQNRYGATVTLNGTDNYGNSIPAQTTSTDSATTFQELAFGRSYPVSFTAPTGTNPTSQSQPSVSGAGSIGTRYTTYSPSGGNSFTACTPASTSVLTPGPSPTGRNTTTTNNTLTFQPNCYVRTTWEWQNDPATYYQEQTRDPIYAWGPGNRSGPDGYKANHFDYNGYNNLGATPPRQNLAFPDWVEQPANGLGKGYYFHHNGASLAQGHWYNVWEWNLYFTGTYGPWYPYGPFTYHGQKWASVETTSICP